MLSKPDIIKHLDEGTLVFRPGIPREAVAQVSIDLRLGRRFSSFKNPPGYLTSIHVDASLWESADLWDHREGDIFTLKPGEFVLAQTLEEVTIPSDLVGFVEGRSSWARCGITVHVTAPKIDPGFSANITLEMANFGRIPVELRAVIDRPAQLMLFRVSTPLPAQDLYGTGPQDQFQHQQQPVPRKAQR